LKPAAGTSVVLAGDDRAKETARRAGSVERRARYRGGKTSESENPRALPARNKAGRLRAEQSVRRLRKPGGAAQSGEANPAWVAARFCKRRRVRKPHGRRSDMHHSFVGIQQADGADTRLSRCDIEGNRVKDDTVGAHRAPSTTAVVWCEPCNAVVRREEMMVNRWRATPTYRRWRRRRWRAPLGSSPGLGREESECVDASLHGTIFRLCLSRVETPWTFRRSSVAKGWRGVTVRFTCRSPACRSRVVCRQSAVVSSRCGVSST
jgi:hypothetical protein